MQPQNYLHIGLLKIIESHTKYLHRMEYYLITNHQDEEKRLLQEK